MTVANLTTPSSPLTMTGLATFLNGVLALIARLSSDVLVNFNQSNTDTVVPINLPAGSTRYRVDQVIVSGASHSLTAATCGLFSAAGGGGTAIVASGTPLTVSSSAQDTNNNMQTFTLFGNVGTTAFSDASLFFRVQNSEGVVATANVTVIYTPLP